MMMDALSIPGRTPMGQTPGQKEMLAAIFGALPEGTMLKALSSIGVQVGDPQGQLAPDDESNAIENWNDRRIVMNGQDARGPVWNRNAVVEVQAAQPRGEEPPYLAPDYDSTLGMMSGMQNSQGGF